MVQFWRAGHILAIGTNMAACSSFCCLFLSIVTDSWLCTKERAIVSNGSFVYVTIYSGLWRRCTLDPRAIHPTTFNCSYIGYFTHVERDGIGPTDSILLSLRKATGFPMVGLVLMLIAQTVCFVSHCSLYRQCLTIAFGVMFVSGGLLTLVGIIIYIGAITEEAGNKMKSKDEFPFLYFYGPSLVMAICSFVASQMTGVIAVNLFLSRKRQKAKCANQAPSSALAVAVVTDAKKSAVTMESGEVEIEKFVIPDHKTLSRNHDDDDADLRNLKQPQQRQQQQQQQHWMDDYFNQQQQQQHHYHQNHHQQQEYYHRIHQHQQQQRPLLTTSNSVDYYHHYNNNNNHHPRKEFIRQDSFDRGISLPRLHSRPSERLRRLVRNYSEETYSWRLHGSESNSPEKSVDNIYLSVHNRLQQHRHPPPKSSSHGRLTQMVPRQLSNASRSPENSAGYDSNTVLHRWYNSSNRLHQANQVARSRLRINNAVADWPVSTLASANQRKVIGSSHVLGAEARRDRNGSRKAEMTRQWSEITPEEGKLFGQSRERLRLSHEELNYSHRRITPV